MRAESSERSSELGEADAVRNELPDDERLERASTQWAKENPEFDLTLFQIASAISMLGQEVEVEFRALAQQLGGDLRPGDLRILLVLCRFGRSVALRPVDLVRHLLVTSGAVTKQIARLEAKKLVVRSRVPSRRGWQIQLTDEGRRIAIEAMRPDALPMFSKALVRFTGEEKEEAVRFLRKLIGRTSQQRGSDYSTN